MGLLRGMRHLYVVPHGCTELPAVRVAAVERMRARGTLLVDKYTVAQLPAAAVLLRDARATSGPQSLLAMAPARSRLRYAPDEARSIDALFQPNSRLLVGNGATESSFKKLAGDFRVLHLATHGYFNKLNPLLSGLELEADGADDGLLQVHEVLGLRLDCRPRDAERLRHGARQRLLRRGPGGRRLRGHDARLPGCRQHVGHGDAVGSRRPGLGPADEALLRATERRRRTAGTRPRRWRTRNGNFKDQRSWGTPTTGRHSSWWVHNVKQPRIEAVGRS